MSCRSFVVPSIEVLCIVSYRIVSYHIVSCRVVSCRVVSCRVVLCCVVVGSSFLLCFACHFVYVLFSVVPCCSVLLRSVVQFSILHPMVPYPVLLYPIASYPIRFHIFFVFHMFYFVLFHAVPCHFTLCYSMPFIPFHSIPCYQSAGIHLPTSCFCRLFHTRLNRFQPVLTLNRGAAAAHGLGCSGIPPLHHQYPVLLDLGHNLSDRKNAPQLQAATGSHHSDAR